MNQEKLVELQMIQQQIESISQNLKSIGENISDVKSIVEDLSDFSKLEKGKEILVSLSNGIFARASLLDASELKVNVGKNTVVTKSTQEVLDMMKSQEDDLLKYQKENEEYYANLSAKAEAIHRELIQQGKEADAQQAQGSQK